MGGGPDYFVSSAARPGPGRGFTLIEVMLVMVILAVMTGVVMTNMHAGYQDLALESDAGQFIQTIEGAERYARTGRCICRLVIDPRAGEYYVVSAGSMAQPFSPAGELGDTVSLSKGIAFSEVHKLKSGSTQDTWIHFFPDGRTEPALIGMVAGEGQEIQVELEELAGPPKLKRR